MAKFVCVKDFEAETKKKLEKPVLDYYLSGADDELTLRENINSLQNIKLNPRVLVDMTKLSMKTTILGREMNLPFGIAPTAMHKLVHKDGEKLVARVALEKNICLTISNLATVKIGDIAKENKSGLRLMQLYVLKNRGYTETLIKLAEQHGYGGLVVTVDAQLFGKRILDVKNGFSSDGVELEIWSEVGKGNMKFREVDEKRFDQSFVGNLDVSLDWSFISWMRKLTKLPIILKGILSVEDALLAHQHGVEAIWISNHGGRQLDTVLPAPLVLPQITAALKKVKSKMEVYADGGVLKGTDIFKLLALGADYVFVGRGFLYGLTEGYEGVRKVADIYESQLRTAMMLCGTRNKKEINKNYLVGYSEEAARAKL